ncbi:MAG: hypothetical protein V4724_01145 [Pseudomonadota bacterium]
MADIDTTCDAGQFKRVMGGFRRMRSSEIGEEQLCQACGEYWPVDAEFFAMSERYLSYICKACQSELARARQQKSDAKAGVRPMGLTPDFAADFCWRSPQSLKIQKK